MALILPAMAVTLVFLLLVASHTPPKEVALLAMAEEAVQRASTPETSANAPAELRRARDKLTAAGVTHKFMVYPGTMHAFHNDTGAAYNQEQALAAWRDMIAWFHQYLA